MSTIPRPQDPTRFRHPLQSVLDAMGSDPALRSERERIKEYIDRSATVMYEADPEQPGLQDHRMEQIRRDVRDEVSRSYLSTPLSERDKEWLQVTTDLLKVLTVDAGGSWVREEYSDVIRALVRGAYARLATDALVEDLARERAMMERGNSPAPDKEA